MTDINQKCRLSHKKFTITEKDQKFYKQINVPLPTRHPEERLRRRLLERNTRILYYRECDLTGKKILSVHHPDAPFPVYEAEQWWTDKWDAMKLSQDIPKYDFGKPFFPQFKALLNKIPHMSTFVISASMQNSDFTNCAGYLKNCYMTFEADYNEDCYHSNRIYHSKNLLDCLIVYESELCYECIDCLKCQRCKFLQECENCQDSAFLRKCIGCHDCIGCINQRHKKYMIFNKQYSPEEYEKKKKEFTLQSLKEKTEKFFQNQIYPAVEMERCENCTGDHLQDSKNSEECFDCRDLEDCKYCVKLSQHIKDCMDYSAWGFNAELLYECSACGDNAFNLKFCSTCTTNISDCQYCQQCTSSKNLFGCVGLQHKEYCILNKQYSRDEYEELLPRIIEHMKKNKEYGEFFPYELCPFAYNESVVMDHLPLEKKEAIKLGYRWREPEKKEYKSGEKILKCEVTGKNYKVIPEELKFYRHQDLPIPRRCPDQRHYDRMAKRNPWKLYDRKCAKTGVPIKTTFAPTRPEIIYSKEAYLKKIY